jgi:hypothetical protein
MNEWRNSKMNDEQTPTPSPRYRGVEGPLIYSNWKEQIQQQPVLRFYEVPLFTDAHFTGMVLDGYGPYQFLNTCPMSNEFHIAQPALVVRVAVHERIEFPLGVQTHAPSYHGGSLDDEIAALIALCLGIRIKAGNSEREFGPDPQDKGLPYSAKLFADPFLPKVHHSPILPSASGAHSLDLLSPLQYLPQLSTEQANVLVQAARLYQEAVWISESEPHLTWVLLVSAIEIAANAWRSDQGSVVERVQEWNPDLVHLLEKHGDTEFVAQVCDSIAHLTGASKKFRDFIIAFLPPPPPARPMEWAQHPWSKGKLRETLNLIYTYRSNALHAGEPFPAPMCWPPQQFSEPTQAFAEKPGSLAAGGRGYNWEAKRIPMYLHTFEYIVRHSLLNWWQSLTTCR